MNTFKLLWVLSGIAAITLILAEAQTESTTTTTTSTYVPTTTIIGSRVTGPQGDEIGQISNVVLDRQTGCMAYVVLATEAGGARKTVAVPWTVFNAGPDTRTYSVRVDKEKIYSAPVWEASRVDEYSRSDWVGQVYSYYGVQPGVGVNVNVNSSSATQEERQRQLREQATQRNEQQSRNPDMRQQRERGQRRMNQPSPAQPSASPAQPSASPAGSASAMPRHHRRTPAPTPAASRSERREQQPEETTGGTPRPARNPDELRQPPTGMESGPGSTPESRESRRDTSDRQSQRHQRQREGQPQPEASPTP
jgi:sporulation protein YlmC with PRC-barrel domain